MKLVHRFSYTTDKSLVEATQALESLILHRPLFQPGFLVGWRERKPYVGRIQGTRFIACPNSAQMVGFSLIRGRISQDENGIGVNVSLLLNPAIPLLLLVPLVGFCATVVLASRRPVDSIELVFGGLGILVALLTFAFSVLWVRGDAEQLDRLLRKVLKPNNDS